MRRNEWLLVTFTASTSLADGMLRVALPVLATDLTRSPAAVAGVAAAISAPWFFAALPVGVLVDRADRRMLMAGAEAVRLAVVGLLLGALATDRASLALLYVLALVLGTAEVVALTAGAAIVPSAVPPKRWEAVNARVTAVEYLCHGFLGAPLGGLLVTLGVAVALGATAVTYALGGLLLAGLAGRFLVTHDRPHRSMPAEIREGLAYLWSQPLLRTMALLIAGLAACWSAWLALLPTYALRPGPLGVDERGFGLLLTCLGAGGVVGAALTGPVNRALGRRWAMFADIVGSFLLVAAPVVATSAWPVGLAAFLAGVGGTLWVVNSRTVTQSLVPAELLGRYNAAYRLVSWGATPVAAAAAGLLAQLAGPRVAFGVFAVLAAACAVPFLRTVTSAALAVAERALTVPTQSPQAPGYAVTTLDSR